MRSTSARGSSLLCSSPPKLNHLLFEVAHHRYTDWSLQGKLPAFNLFHCDTNAVIKETPQHAHTSRTQWPAESNQEVGSRSVFVPRAGKMNGDCFVSGEGRRFFFDIIKARGGESGSAKKSCYSHQLVGMGLLKRLSRKGFGRGPLEFCHSQTPLFFGMTMLTAGSSYLQEGRKNSVLQPHFH